MKLIHLVLSKTRVAVVNVTEPPLKGCVNHKTEFNIESETSDGIERNDNTYDNATSTKPTWRSLV